jgi:TIR domain
LASGNAVFEWDVFVSYAHEDAARVYPLVDALRSHNLGDRKLSVFVDEESVDVHESITGRTREGLANSAVMLIFYSRTYPTRPACQRELTAGFLAAQGSDEASGRILVINPEPDDAHIEPVELRDLRYQPEPSTRQERKQFAAGVARFVAAAPGPLRASVMLPETIRWWPSWPVLSQGFLGRYAEMWRLHSALHAGRFPLAGHVPPVSVAVVSGMPGIGKTALAQQYAVEFGAAFPGGVTWLSLDGEYGPFPDAEAMSRYYLGLRGVASWHEISAHGIPGERLRMIMAGHITQRGEPCLWVLDGVPAGLAAETVRGMVIPSPHMHTIITSADGQYGEVGASLPLKGLSPAESLELLAGCYDPDEEADVRGLASDLGGHPLALRLTAAMLSAQSGVVSVAEFRRRTGAPAAVLAGMLADASEIALSVLRLASVLAPGVIPPGLLAAALARWSGRAVDDVTDMLITALTWMQRRGIITRGSRAISVHPVVLRALPGGDSASWRAAAAAALADLVARGGTDSLEMHIRQLAFADDLADEVAITLLDWLSRADEHAGDYASAGQARQRLAARLRQLHGPSDSRVLSASAAAARCFTAVGAYATAVSLARAAATTAAPQDVTAAVQHALATALDGLGQFGDADPHWKEVADALSAMPADEAADWRVDWARALRLRGKLDNAAAVLAAVAGDAPPLRYVEQAKLYQLTARPILAQRAATQAITAYREKGWDNHPACLEATGIVIDAEVTIFSRKPGWREPGKLLAELDKLWHDYSRQYGPDNPLTLAARVNYALQAAAWTSPGSRETIREAEQVARAWLGEDHPYRLRAVYGLSMAAVFDKDLQTGLDLAREAYEGQRRILGEHHPDTLTSALQLAVTRYLLNGDVTAIAPVRSASRELRQILGPVHFDVWRGRFAEAFMLLPAPLFRGVAFGALSLLQGADRADRTLKSIFRSEKQKSR